MVTCISILEYMNAEDCRRDAKMLKDDAYRAHKRANDLKTEQRRTQTKLTRMRDQINVSQKMIGELFKSSTYLNQRLST